MPDSVTQILRSGPVGSKKNIAVLGDGFAAADQAAYNNKEGKTFADLLLVDGHLKSVLEPLARKYRGSSASWTLARPRVWEAGAFGTTKSTGPRRSFMRCHAPLNQHIARLLLIKKRAAIGL